MATQPLDHLSHHDLPENTSEAFQKTYCLALDSFEPSTDYGNPLTDKEKAILRSGGLILERIHASHPFAESAFELATIMEHSLTPKEVGERLGVTTSCIRRKIANRSLYSFLINRTRYIPDFQFVKNRLIPGIDKVNQTLDPELHPLEVYNWLHYPNVDLFLNDDLDQTVSPLEWLKRGKKPDLVEQLARFI